LPPKLTSIPSSTTAYIPCQSYLFAKKVGFRFINFSTIPIIDITELGNLSAVKLVEEMGIVS
jgi:hypothetical protein